VNVVCRILGHLDGPIERLETRIDGQAEKLRYWQCERCRLTDRHPLPSCGLDFVISTFGFWGYHLRHSFRRRKTVL
jgi:hypothetical protein